MVHLGHAHDERAYDDKESLVMNKIKAILRREQVQMFFLSFFGGLGYLSYRVFGNPGWGIAIGYGLIGVLLIAWAIAIKASGSTEVYKPKG